MKRSDRNLIKKVFVEPSINDDKYSRGVLGVLTGSKSYPGAASLTTKATLRTGVGLVRFLTGIKELNYLVLEKSPEVVIKDSQVQAWLIGSGIEKNGGKFKTRRKIKKALNQKLPTVLDAGAINFVTRLETNSIITPHYKELQELLTANSIEVSLSEIKKDPLKWAKKASLEFKTTVLLKGNTTIICDAKSVVEIKSGTTYLATAGSGDVLSGILGALVATNYLRLRNKTISLLEIAHAAVVIHQEVSLEASNAGPISASMIIEKISPVIAKALSTKFI
ncbi:MAG: hypothetical protein RLZZ37_1240 [Actinomycetota bacterium]|jgi:hydroxyethylthiazole kinase-like uncharacterized protein yjeF